VWWLRLAKFHSRSSLVYYYGSRDDTSPITLKKQYEKRKKDKKLVKILFSVPYPNIIVITNKLIKLAVDVVQRENIRKRTILQNIHPNVGCQLIFWVRSEI
jgi:hypothetical protein